ncbi:hypothetical protein Z517_03581 [Fonsecaea pedrosoi CBS 271.37]|uniref:Uncharacterized protein n=1 Tax=Fonsecaea pedrosoi CBS 271.37 TaxID=1442368 RepID=A0A0D2E2M7_9EURO|nr:uncharacterized protein Z517_03581 [Fonsecaea pedrosoi CBS 271.37]KIW84331.1 hypothetical protein Z517_03581 [Fonsecaea pedrosoi CBS 271.37]
MAPSIGEYDQVVAITQQMINNSLQDLFAINQANAVSAGHAADAVIPNFGPGTFAFKDFKLGCPRVIVHYSDEDKYHVLYQIHITSGSFVTQKSWTDTTPLTWPIQDWYFAYSVNIGKYSVLQLKFVAADSLRKKHDIPGDYSIQKLIMNMKDPDISSATMTQSYFGGYENDKTPKLSEDNLKNIKILMTTIGEGQSNTMLHMQDLNVLGYVTNGPQNKAVVESPKATFIPCGLQFQTYPYKSNGNAAGDGTTGNSRLNYLCYLEKTLNPGQKDAPPMPSGDKKYLGYDGNWTAGSISTSNGQDNITDDLPLGAFVLTSGNFMDQYLFPRLRDIIARMAIGWSDLSAGAWANSTWAMGVNLHINDPGNVKDSEYKFSKTQNGPKTVWTFTKSWPQDLKRDHGAQSIKVTAESSCEVKITATGDSPTINVEGTSYIRLYSEVWWGLEDNAASKGDDLHRSFKWNFNLTLQSVNDGGLQIIMTDRGHHVDYDASDRRDLKDKFGGIIDWLEGWFNTFNFDNLGSLENVLANDIGRASKLVFPCSGVFFYKNPVMTDRGDLMCSVGYKPSGETFGGAARVNPPVLAPTDPKTVNEKTDKW